RMEACPLLDLGEQRAHVQVDGWSASWCSPRADLLAGRLGLEACLEVEPASGDGLDVALGLEAEVDLWVLGHAVSVSSLPRSLAGKTWKVLMRGDRERG